jgi:hypothetical protein
MTLQDYANWVPLPAPVTTGTTLQTFIDPVGDVWVAMNGVNNGNWARARSVLYCRVFRNAAYTSPAVNSAFIYDTVGDDVYGMWASPNIVAPIRGNWMVGASIEIVPTATSDVAAFYLNAGGFSFRSGSVTAPAGLTVIRSVVTSVLNVTGIPFNAPFNITVQTEYLTAGRAVGTGDGRTCLWAKYMGA